jgi:hypothetical protein
MTTSRAGQFQTRHHRVFIPVVFRLFSAGQIFHLATRLITARANTFDNQTRRPY